MYFIMLEKGIFLKPKILLFSRTFPTYLIWPHANSSGSDSSPCDQIETTNGVVAESVLKRMLSGIEES
jgi:hypothetical protein